jgi:hypothetical protein
MENTFSHELVSVIKRACFSRHGNALRPTLLVVGASEQDLLLTAVLNELALDSTLSMLSSPARKGAAHANVVREDSVHENATHANSVSKNAAHANITHEHAVREEVVLQRSLLQATIILVASELPRQSREQIVLSQKPLLEWSVVKRDACPLFWPAHSVIDFFIVHQDSVVTSPTRTISHEGEEQ